MLETLGEDYVLTAPPRVFATGRSSGSTPPKRAAPFVTLVALSLGLHSSGGGAIHRRVRVLVSRHRACDRWSQRSTSATTPSSRAPSGAHAVRDLFQLRGDLLYFKLDPRVTHVTSTASPPHPSEPSAGAGREPVGGRRRRRGFFASVFLGQPQALIGLIILGTLS